MHAPGRRESGKKKTPKVDKHVHKYIYTERRRENQQTVYKSETVQVFHFGRTVPKTFVKNSYPVQGARVLGIGVILVHVLWGGFFDFRFFTPATLTNETPEPNKTTVLKLLLLCCRCDSRARGPCSRVVHARFKRTFDRTEGI